MTNKCLSLDKFESKRKTYGFKGESLASIINVSKKVQIASKFGESGTYLKTFLNGEAENEVIKIKNRPSKGTTVTIDDFLYNYPVRQRRINKLDLNSVKNVLEQLTIIFPNVSFSLKNEETDEVILNSHKEISVSHILCTLNNTLDIKKFAEFKVVKASIKVSGIFYMTSTSIKNMQYVFVNKFPVTADGIQKVIKKSLYNKMEDIFLSKLAFPVYVVNIQCSYSEVILNFDSTKFQAEFKSWRMIKRCIEKMITLYIKKYNKQNEGNTEKTNEINGEDVHTQKMVIKNPRKRLGMRYAITDYCENKKSGLRNNKLQSIEKKRSKIGNLNESFRNKLFGLFDDQFNSQAMHLSPALKSLKITEKPVEIDNEEEGKKVILGTFMKSLSLSQKSFENKSQHINPISTNKSDNKNQSTPSSKEYEKICDDNSNMKNFQDLSLCLKETPQDIQAKKRRIDMLNSVGTNLIEKKLKLQSQQQLESDNPKILISTSTSPFISYRTIACQTETPKEKEDNNIHLTSVSPLKNDDVSFLNQFWDDDKIKENVEGVDKNLIMNDLTIFGDENYKNHNNFRKDKSKESLFFGNQRNDDEDLIFGGVNLSGAKSRVNRSRNNILKTNSLEEMFSETKKKIESIKTNQINNFEFLETNNWCEDLIFDNQNLINSKIMSRKSSREEIFCENQNKNKTRCREKKRSKDLIYSDQNLKNYKRSTSQEFLIFENQREIEINKNNQKNNFDFFESTDELINLTQKDLLFQDKPKHLRLESDKKNESIFFKKNLINQNKIEDRNNRKVRKYKSDNGNEIFGKPISKEADFERSHIFKSPHNDLFNQNTTFNSHYFQVQQKKTKLIKKSKKNIELNTNNTLHDLTSSLFKGKNLNNDINKSKFFNDTSFFEPIKKKIHKKESILDTSTFHFKTPIKKDSKINNQLLTESEISFNLFKPMCFSSQKDDENKFKFDFFENISFEKSDNKKVDIDLNILNDSEDLISTKIEDKSKKENIFLMQKRIDFVPKGFSPILLKEHVLNVTLSPNSKKNLNNFIVKSYEEELNLVKWTDYIDKENPKDFLVNLYNEKKKLIEKDVPSVEKNVKNMIPIHFDKKLFNTSKIIGQLDRKFIVVVSKNQLLLFDQHAVHERVRLEGLYQEYMTKSNTKYPKFKSIRINKLIKINFDEEKLAILTTYKNLFSEIGFEYETFSSHILIKKIPECLHRKNVEDQCDDFFCKFVESVLTEEMTILKETGGIRSNIPRLLQHVMSTEACRGAIKFGRQLTQVESEKYMKMLSKCQLPFQCAHGRPTLYPILVLSPLVNENKKINFKKI
ncbi:DNA mismatch repair protein Mlh3-like isoform X2 [Onthophagus taurus]